MRMRRRAHRLNFTSALLTRLAGARRLFRAVCDLEGHVVSPVNASRLPSRTVPRASLGVGAAGWALPRGGLPPPISLPASWRTPVRVKLRTARFEHNASVGPPKLTPLHEVNRAAAAKILSSGAHAGHLSRSLSGTFGYCFASILGYNRDAARRHVNHVRASC